MIRYILKPYQIFLVGTDVRRVTRTPVLAERRGSAVAVGYQKISVNLSDEILDSIREIASRDNVTMTEALRRAISVYKFLDDAQRAGKSILVRDPETKETERLVFR
jgi:Ribbon-helix-helix protein, copG family